MIRISEFFMFFTIAMGMVLHANSRITRIDEQIEGKKAFKLYFYYNFKKIYRTMLTRNNQHTLLGNESGLLLCTWPKQ